MSGKKMPIMNLQLLIITLNNLNKKDLLNLVISSNRTAQLILTEFK